MVFDNSFREMGNMMEKMMQFIEFRFILTWKVLFDDQFHPDDPIWILTADMFDAFPGQKVGWGSPAQLHETSSWPVKSLVM